jgi:hypothetical protein
VERVMFVEILDRRFRVRERIKLDRFPTTIGRAYTNDIIIDDRFVSPVHLSISIDDKGNIRAEDTGSRNGTYISGTSEVIKEVVLGRETILRIGSSVLRFRSSDYAVGPEIVSDSGGGLFNWISEKRGRAVALFMSSYFFILLSNVVHSYDRVFEVKFLGGIFLVGLLFAMWTGLWSLINRLVSHSFTFLPHLAIAGIGVFLFWLFDIIDEYYSFLFSPGDLMIYIKFAGMAIIFYFVIFGHMTVIKNIVHNKKQAIAAVITVCIFSSFGVFYYLGMSGFTHNPEFEFALKPVGKNLIMTESPDDFFEKISSLKADVDELALKK